MSHLVAGVDLGSTFLKVVVEDEDAHPVAETRVPTPWRTGGRGRTDLHPEDLGNAVAELFRQAAELLPDDAHVAAIALAGMGETGFVMAKGRPRTPGMAWFDPRGAQQVAELPRTLREEFPGHTGLPWGVQVTAAKLAWLRDHDISPAGTIWASLPEWVATRLGCPLVAEPSLIARTGLIDQGTGAPWEELLTWLGLTPAFIPPRLVAGELLGVTRSSWLPPCFHDARVTVAGHDHLVAAAGLGLEPDTWLVSFGTAEVLLRVLESPLDFRARQHLGRALINCVPHVLPGRSVLVAGVKSGLLLRRVLQLIGITDAAGRERLDRAVLELDGSGLPTGAVEISGARNDDGELHIRIVSDGVTPQELFLATLKHGNDEIRRLLGIIHEKLPPAVASRLSGGWTDMGCVVRARSEVLPGLTVSPHRQGTANGAAAFARRLITT
ncbi:MAG: FGGY family carbohydrate kinase [Arachnia propionica]|uniref:FGGY family carbohydrate kinase n=1 Tax=Arachnia propionica TaxID=1750 RepID=UPI0026F9C0C4|nr:FGGY family carbohydrate kinase [Arachnia propionica]